MHSEHQALLHVSHSTVDTSMDATGRSRASRLSPQHHRQASSSSSSPFGQPSASSWALREAWITHNATGSRG
eukprot:scaffold6456_cov98-Isochrysis_galbana.AAC.9